MLAIYQQRYIIKVSKEEGGKTYGKNDDPTNETKRIQ